MREPREHLKTLQRRVDFLKSRDHKNSFDQAELGSLEWALVNLQTKRKPLMDEEIGSCIDEVNLTSQYGHHHFGWHKQFARAIEAAHGIKENV